MRKDNLLTSIFAVVLLASPIVGAETDYPASDFKPKVQYQDAEYIAKSEKAEGTSASTTPSASSEDDAQYPAANFKPKVLFKDSEYKHDQSAAKSAAQQSSAAAVVRAEINNETEALGIASEKKESSDNTALIGIVVLAVAGFLFMRKRSGSSATNTRVARPAAVTPGSAEGKTGVARYLKQKEIASATGVTKYLEKKTATAKAQSPSDESGNVTGVAKYLEKKIMATETGVSKYLRNKG